MHLSEENRFQLKYFKSIINQSIFGIYDKNHHIFQNYVPFQADIIAMFGAEGRKFHI